MEFDVASPAVMASVAVCAGAWLMIALDVRRSDQERTRISPDQRARHRRE